MFVVVRRHVATDQVLIFEKRAQRLRHHRLVLSGAIEERSLSPAVRASLGHTISLLINEGLKRAPSSLEENLEDVTHFRFAARTAKGWSNVTIPETRLDREELRLLSGLFGELGWRAVPEMAGATLLLASPYAPAMGLDDRDAHDIEGFLERRNITWHDARDEESALVRSCDLPGVAWLLSGKEIEGLVRLGWPSVVRRGRNAVFVMTRLQMPKERRNSK